MEKSKSRTKCGDVGQCLPPADWVVCQGLASLLWYEGRERMLALGVGAEAWPCHQSERIASLLISGEAWTGRDLDMVVKDGRWNGQEGPDARSLLSWSNAVGLMHNLIDGPDAAVLFAERFAGWSAARWMPDVLRYAAAAISSVADAGDRQAALFDVHMRDAVGMWRVWRKSSPQIAPQRRTP